MNRGIEFIESYIKVGNDYQWNDNHGEIVRCKNCVFAEPVINGRGEHGYRCNNSDSPVDNNRWLDADWFCADGERQVSDDDNNT